MGLRIDMKIIAGVVDSPELISTVNEVSPIAVMSTDLPGAAPEPQQKKSSS